LVLSSVLHIDAPTGNIKLKDAEKLRKSRLVKTAVPVSYGDNYKGVRILGTETIYLKLYNAELATGELFSKSQQVVLGSTTAKKLQLKIGDTFLSSHGLADQSLEEHHGHPFKVVGILKPTGSVVDNLIITNLESIWDVHHHHENEANHEEHEHEHDESDDEKEITSLLINFKNPRGLLTFPRKINKDTNMQASLPKYQLHKLYEYTSIGFKTIALIAYLILIISCITIFISLYKMVKERAFDLAILRTYGASNFQLIKMIFFEGLTIVFSSFLVGYLLLKIGFNFMLHFMDVSYQQNIFVALPFQDILQIGILILMMVIFSVSLAIYPIIKMNISTILSNEK